jgi:hypothetical protein
VQDNWRVTRKLTLNLGLRAEYEGGSTERYNRMIGGFDLNASLPISAVRSTAYAASPIPELPAANFKIVGGSLYPGTGSTARNLSQGQLMWLPRFGMAYHGNEKNGGARRRNGIYYDTINVLNFGPDQSGFNAKHQHHPGERSGGRVWNPLFGANSPANQKSPLVDPYPVRSDGTRFTLPTGSALGIMAKAGRGFGYTDYNQEHAPPAALARECTAAARRELVVDAAYAGAWSDRISIAHKLDILPEQYGQTEPFRNDAIAEQPEFQRQQSVPAEKLRRAPAIVRRRCTST